MIIYLKQKYAKKDSSFDDYHFLTYVGLRMMQTKQRKAYIVTVDQLCAELYGTTQAPRAIRTGIKKSIEEFIEGGLELVQQINRTTWEIDLSMFFVDTMDKESPFIMVDTDAIRKILTLDVKEDTKHLLRYYCVMLSTVFNDIGKYSHYKLMDLLDLGKPTLLRYHQILETNGLIYIHHMGAYRNDNGKLKSLTNYYGLPEHKDKIDKAAMTVFRGDVDKELIKARPNANKMRAIRQKIKNGKEITSEEIEIINDENEHIDEVNSHLVSEDKRKECENRRIDLTTIVVKDDEIEKFSDCEINEVDTEKPNRDTMLESAMNMLISTTKSRIESTMAFERALGKDVDEDFYRKQAENIRKAEDNIRDAFHPIQEIGEQQGVEEDMKEQYSIEEITDVETVSISENTEKPINIDLKLRSYILEVKRMIQVNGTEELTQKINMLYLEHYTVEEVEKCLNDINCQAIAV